ncbi:hypothetical protein D0C36_22915 [Mucilaginibacter conchicola]|uniref:Signal transduction histidine kinase internal region domain-containing protein n=1 Tax=Mucilaginibacter conchicola TaxID=2303333 RepID=A0A372NMC6_9SPHI|nr:histidine kinase [Mucilaginibacter conchicola]RFZ90096.1 hypothetical protein D0C36_22915 [Mucilaginibacter conchicola]
MTTMKVRWKYYEMLLVVGAAVLVIVKLQLAGISVLLFLLAWFWLNKLIIPMATSRHRVRVCTAVLQLLLLSYLLGPGINLLSFYSDHKFYFPGGFPLTIGYHPQPLFNAFGGWAVSILLIALYLVYALFREWIIQRIEESGIRKAFYTLVVNRITAFAFGVLAIPFGASILGLFDGIYYHYYFALVPSTIAIGLACYYYLFPFQMSVGWRSREFISKILAVTFLIVIIFSLFLGEYWQFKLVIGWFLFVLLIIIPLIWLTYRNKKDLLSEFSAMRYDLAASQANLGALKMQINPHFLFNALNALYAMALQDGSINTATGIQQLGDMMRFMLEDNQQDRIPLQTELTYLRNYTDLQRLRFTDSDRLTITIDIKEGHDEELIAPMLLIPFIENAFKHGIRQEVPSWINLVLNVRAGKLYFQIANSLHSPLENDPERKRRGIGLQNVCDRLSLLYPGEHHLQYGAEANTFTVTLTLNLKN